MNVRQWFLANKDSAIRERLAEESGSSLKYLLQIYYGSKKPSSELLANLYKASRAITPDQIIYPRDERPETAKIYDIKPQDKAA